jgi:small subunit ribosomal protein S3Ae
LLSTSSYDALQREIGKTLVNRTAGTKIASEGLKGRVFEVSLADLEKDSEDKAFRKIRLISEDVQGRNVLLNFHGLDFTADKLRSLVKKWHTLIESITDVKTTDGYTLRVFVLAFTKKAQYSIKKTAYAQTSQIRAIRAKIVEIVHREVTTSDLKGVVGKLKTESIGADIEKTAGVYEVLSLLPLI